MNLTHGQEKGIQLVRDLLADPYMQVAVIGGFAGTGKTTLLKYIAEATGIPVIVTPTGKAAARVREATGLGAMTVHRWMYAPIPNEETGEVEFTRLPPDNMAKGESGLLVVEESSMIGVDLWNDIREAALDLGLKILCIGDPFQLMPVDSNEDHRGFSILDPAQRRAQKYVLLDEVLRQAQDSPVIRASMALRRMDVMGALKELPQVPASKFMETAAHIQARGGTVICHKNTTRHWLNQRLREALGLGEALQRGEPILVLKNNYVTMVFNGETYTYSHWIEQTPGIHAVHDPVSKTREKTKLGIASLVDPLDGRDFQGVLFHEELPGRLATRPMFLDKTADILYPGVPIVHANYGYVMTTHKAQGSEWSEVLIAWEPSLRFWGKNQEDAYRWAYTAVTRSREKCLLGIGMTAPAL